MMPGFFRPHREAVAIAVVFAVMVASPPRLAIAGAPHPWVAHGPLHVSRDGHRLVHTDGTPFLWLGDTAWALHQNISREEVQRYLDDVHYRRFTVIQLMSVNVWALKNGKNYYGAAPYLQGKPWKLNPPYWQHLAWVIDQAAERGLYVLLVYGTPGRTDKHGPYCKTPAEAYAYGKAVGEFLGRRPNLLWSSGIDVRPDDAKRVSPMGMAGWHAMAEGITDGVTGRGSFDGKADWDATLMTYHPCGGYTSSKWFHRAPWLDFNGAQVGLGGSGLVAKISADYVRRPSKPVVELEPWYEGCTWKKPPVGAWEVRCEAYQSLFAGAWGFTYGNYYIYQFDSHGEHGDLRWRQHLDDEGRRQMRYVRKLMQRTGFAERTPAQDLLLSVEAEEAKSLDPTERIAACLASDGSVAFVYTPRGVGFRLNLSGRLRWPRILAAWYNPRTGEEQALGSLEAVAARSFDPPGKPGPGQDWCLIIEGWKR